MGQNRIQIFSNERIAIEKKHHSYLGFYNKNYFLCDGFSN